MNEQASLFDLLRGPPMIRPVDPDGHVVQGAPDETLTLPHPRMAWPLARIELNRDCASGLWMWSVSIAGGGYKVGAKWGRFASTRDDALFHASRELLAKAARVRDPSSVGITAAQMRQIEAWAMEVAA